MGGSWVKYEWGIEDPWGRWLVTHCVEKIHSHQIEPGSTHSLARPRWSSPRCISGCRHSGWVFGLMAGFRMRGEPGYCDVRRLAVGWDHPTCARVLPATVTEDLSMADVEMPTTRRSIRPGRRGWQWRWWHSVSGIRRSMVGRQAEVWWGCRNRVCMSF